MSQLTARCIALHIPLNMISSLDLHEHHCEPKNLCVLSTVDFSVSYV